MNSDKKSSQDKSFGVIESTEDDVLKSLHIKLDQAVAEKSFGIADKLQQDINEFTKLHKELQLAIQEKRYSDVESIQNNMDQISDKSYSATAKIRQDIENTKSYPDGENVFIKPTKKNGKVSSYACSFIDQRSGFECLHRTRNLPNMKNHIKNTHK